MAETINEVRVRMAADGFYPQAFRWAGRDVRVLSIEGLRTCGRERRFRVRTVEGVYELTHDTRGAAVAHAPQPDLVQPDNRAAGAGAAVFTAAGKPAAPRAGQVTRPATFEVAASRQWRQQEAVRGDAGGSHASGFAVVR